ncbi:nuclear transport factor 2 family protein [Pandoraea sp.]|uniref:nuclear transport factor 2 family protein n=1 Tax=Pandoraea sp. TaxID=1883445 RepID=UPI001222B794|nr:nuclear transport factor 2 family protein [Pandoraea sp.]TAL56258.1 MAG: nuclear transport factor 2 family protein [Pandoraea sp.]TAM19213.1 MAG: nuclear transport factor 2 family protein [Pandoraea sp.]
MNSKSQRPDVASLVDRYFAAWNTTDAGRRRELIAQTWSEDAAYLDPLMQGEGHAGIDAMLQAVQAQFAGLAFRHIGEIDAHHDCMRFSWELAPADGAAVAGGTDFGQLSADGRLRAVTGFIDFMPTTA